MGTLILIVEDDPVVRNLVSSTLAREGMVVMPFETGAEGLKAVSQNRPALVLLDVNLPDMDGWEILRRLRDGSTYQPSVIMLTTRHKETDRIQGLNMGADDYICKPFSSRELVARVRAVLRRVNERGAKRNEINFVGLRIDITGRSVWRRGEPVHLTPKEFDLLVTLAGKPNQVLERKVLYSDIWGDSAHGSGHTLEVHIDRLRRKLAVSDGESLVKTVKGKGYKLQVTGSN
ncbi:MAG: response regulator transcription factor [Armatimonadota bacterium]|jgi:DNA-binding response OmpR family regulator|nr:DNA-binding response regulator [Armatimonadota bacterium]